MDFQEYQQEAVKTDQTPLRLDNYLPSILIPVLGLSGEVGSLTTEFKKYLRDGDNFILFQQKIAEELGDILWYVSSIASKQNLSLNDIASANIRKINDRWQGNLNVPSGRKLFDDDFPSLEQFPRVFELTVKTKIDDNGVPRVQLFYGDLRLGDELSDNTYQDDGYRLHDVFHLAFTTVLGWSPVMRKLFGRKRKSNKIFDENEDGGRANVIDEAIAALIFIEAKNNNFFDGIYTVQYQVLRTIKDLTAHLEVSQCSMKEWEVAIMTGFQVWRKLKESHNGTLRGDLINRTLEFIPLSK